MSLNTPQDEYGYTGPDGQDRPEADDGFREDSVSFDEQYREENPPTRRPAAKAPRKAPAARPAPRSGSVWRSFIPGAASRSPTTRSGSGSPCVCWTAKAGTCGWRSATKRMKQR